MDDFEKPLARAVDAALVMRAVENLGFTRFLLAACHEQRRSGIICRSFQVCADEPLLVATAVARGHWIAPVIRDARCFALSSVTPQNRLALRKFQPAARPRDGDPFDVVRAARLRTGAPTLVESRLVLDCEVMRHYDLEADHELYIGRVVAARVDGRQVLFETGDAAAKPKRPALTAASCAEPPAQPRPLPLRSAPMTSAPLRNAARAPSAEMPHAARQKTEEPVASQSRPGEPSPGIGRLAHLLGPMPRTGTTPGDDGSRGKRRDS